MIRMPLSVNQSCAKGLMIASPGIISSCEWAFNAFLISNSGEENPALGS